MLLELEMADSVVQEIYNDLSLAWVYNKKSKVRHNNYLKLYSDKANIIAKCIKLINDNHIEQVKYRISEQDDMLLISFKFYGIKVKHNSFSYHLPKIYRNILTNNEIVA